MDNSAIRMNAPILVDDTRAILDILEIDDKYQNTGWGSWLAFSTLPARGPDEEEEKEL
jgi:hypothetical protein